MPKKKQKNRWKLPALIGGAILSIFVILAITILVLQGGNKQDTQEMFSSLKTAIINLSLPSGANPNAGYAPGRKGQYGVQPCHLSGGKIVNFKNIGLIENINLNKNRPWFRPSWTFTKKGNISAGKYKITLEAFDGYSGRRNTRNQNHEQYRVLFKKGNKTVATTGYSSDIPDGVDSAKKITKVANALNIPSFDKIVVEHIDVAHPNTSKTSDSVRAVCMKMEKIPDPVDGKCGSIANSQTSLNTAPTKNLCAKGTPTKVTEGSDNSGKFWTWKCKGSNGGKDSGVCKVRKKSNPPSCEARFVPDKIIQSTKKETASLYIKVSDNTTDVSYECKNYPNDILNNSGSLTSFLEQLKQGKSFPNTQAPYDKVGKRKCVITVKNTEGDKKTCEAEIEVTARPIKCGDGKVDNGEECDDGNTKNGDGCSSSCKKENGAINLTKTVSKNTVKKGETVTYTYLVKNTANANLKNVKITDDKLGNISCPQQTLQSQEKMSCIKKAKITEKVTNKATVTAKDPHGATVTDTDIATVAIVGEKPKPEPKKEEKEEDCNSSIGNYIWYDTNGNGVQEDIEEGIEDIEVCAFRGNKKYCDTTNRHGKYEIEDLCKGTYTVIVKDVGGMVQTYDPDGKLDNKTKVKLKSNDKHTKADFGYRGSAPKTGLVTNIIALIGISILITMGVLIYLRKQGKF